MTAGQHIAEWRRIIERAPDRSLRPLPALHSIGEADWPRVYRRLRYAFAMRRAMDQRATH